MDLQIANKTNYRLDKSWLKKIAEMAAKLLGAKKNSELSLVLVGEEEIKKINKKYRRKNRPTDVLSFEDLNEIFICPQAVKKQAKNLKIPFKTELTRVLVHGILHLAGYDHEGSKKQANQMKILEENIFNKISG